MTKLIKIFLFSLLPFAILAQEKAANSEVYGHDWQFVTAATPSGFTGATPNFTGTLTPPSPGANLLNVTGFTLSNIAVGDIFVDGNKGMYEITAINTPGTSPNVTVKIINDPFLLDVKVAPNGKGAVMRPTPEIGLLVPYVSDGGAAGGLTFTQLALIQNYNMVRVDSAMVGVGGGGAAIDSTQTIGDTIYLHVGADSFLVSIVPDAPVASVNGETGTVVLDGSEINSTYTPTNYVAGEAGIDNHLTGIDAAIGAVDPANYNAKVNDIIATDKLIVGDSIVNFNKAIDQIRDSTITYVNVDWFGATPNDNTDNDFPAIATAIASGYDVVFSPNATYRIDTTVTTGWDVQPGQTIDQQGATIYTTGIKSSLCNLYVLEAADTNVTLRNIRFHGDRNFPDYTGTSADSTSNFRLIVAQDGGTGLKVENLYAYGGSGSTMKMRQQTNAELRNLNFIQCIQSIEIFRSKHINVDGFYSLRDSLNDSDQYHHTYVDESSFINWGNSHMIGGNGKSFHIKDAGGNQETAESININNVTLDSTGNIYLGNLTGINFSNITIKNMTTAFGGENGVENLNVSNLNIFNNTSNTTSLFNQNDDWYDVTVTGLNTQGPALLSLGGLHNFTLSGGVMKNPVNGDNAIISTKNNESEGDFIISDLKVSIDTLDTNITYLINLQEGQSADDDYHGIFENCHFINSDSDNSISYVATSANTIPHITFSNCTANTNFLPTTSNDNITLENCTSDTGNMASPYFRTSSGTLNTSSDFYIFEYTGVGGDSLTIDSFQIQKKGNEFQILTSTSLKIKPETGLIEGGNSITISNPTRFVSNGTNLTRIGISNASIGNIFNTSGTASGAQTWDIGTTTQSWTRNTGTQFITINGSTGKMSIGGTGTITTERFDVNGRMRVKSETGNGQGYIYFGAGSDYMREASGRWYFTDQGGVEDFLIDLNGSSAGIFRNLEGDFYLDANQSGKSLFLTTQTTTRLGIASTGAITFNNFTSSSAFPGTTSHFTTQNSSGQFLTKDAATFKSELGIACTDSSWVSQDTIFHRSYDCTLDTSTIQQSRLIDADGDTKIQVEEMTDEDVIRFDAGGSEVATMSASQMTIANSGQFPLSVQGGFHSHIITTSPNAGGNAYMYFENSGDADNSWAIGRTDDGAFELIYDAAQPFSSTDNTITFPTGVTGEVPIMIKGSATLDFPDTAGGASSDLTITVTGAAVGDVVSVGAPALPTNGSYSAVVTATDTVTVRFSNNDLVSSVNPASGTFKVQVYK